VEEVPGMSRETDWKGRTKRRQKEKRGTEDEREKTRVKLPDLTKARPQDLTKVKQKETYT
jgi:hypothetical protein